MSVPLAPEDHVARDLLDLHEAWILGRVDVARAGQVDFHVQSDAAGPIRHNDDPIAEQDCFLYIMGDEKRRAPQVLPQPRQFERKLLAGQRIERTERLVEQQQLRIGQAASGWT